MPQISPMWWLSILTIIIILCLVSMNIFQPQQNHSTNTPLFNKNENQINW